MPHKMLRKFSYSPSLVSIYHEKELEFVKCFCVCVCLLRWSCSFCFLFDFFFNLFLFIYFWLHWVPAATCGPSLVVESGGCSAVVEQGPSCSAACGILPGQGSNPCLPHWQADSQPLRHQGSPSIYMVYYINWFFSC